MRLSIKTSTPVEWVEEESYFFRLSAYQEKLLELFKRPDYVLPRERLNEVESFVRGGLQDLSISRTTFDWGVPVPGNPKHVMYVWVDALTNYITAVGYPDTESEKFKKYWPADLHVIGKDIVRFHAVYWPAFLMSAGLEVPRRIFSHGFLFNRGEKMSKSVGNVVDPFTMADTYGVDQLRYFFLREVPFGQDGNYNHDAIVGADQCRSRQRSRQSGAAFADHGCAPVRRQGAGAGRVHRQRQGNPGPGRRHDRQGARGDEDAAAASSCWRRCGPWSRKPTATLPARRRGRWPRPIRSGRAPSSTSPRKCCGRSRSWRSRSRRKARRNCWICSAVPPEERVFAALGGETRIKPGSALPAPAPVFPRYVEPTAAAAG